MTTILTLLPVLLIAAFAMYVQYRSLSEARRKSPVWRVLCVLPVGLVVIFLVWVAFHAWA
jgi:hypothetical protein